jgi:hypothetical protein
MKRRKMKDDDAIHDKIGKLPVIKSPIEALNEIIKVSNDKRGHVLLSDQVNWLELKLKVCKKLANLGLQSKK